eukprot:CAMPEP_0183589578 /NCGR_PEP_ID=MMETSP0371-20130417/162988_1 /TAXON_ID=268820 /ORGANISM="Peridinium aciculiferum, Strain PAER-2" /LENGTH=57 /DNA_ID=CAMNT_0025800899 /DNA_START=12 /DNA_END=182 /DNA_ORIENTATION=+
MVYFIGMEATARQQRQQPKMGRSVALLAQPQDRQQPELVRSVALPPQPKQQQQEQQQ